MPVACSEGIDFFAVEVEALRVDDSAPAPHFKVVAQPNAWTKQTKKSGSSGATERGLRYQRFFEDVLGRFKDVRPGLTSASHPGPFNWLGFTAGRPGFSFNWGFGAKGLKVELYIDVQDKAANEAFLDALRARESDLSGLQDELVWEPLPNRRASRLATYHPVPVDPPLDENPDLADWAIETMISWNDVLRPIITDLEAS